MANNWNYTREESENGNSRLIGKHRCVITSAEEKVSKSGNPMIEIKLRPSGCRFEVKFWLVQNDSFNKNATQFFDAFPEVGEGNFELITWTGCEGAANFGEDENGYLKVKWLVDADRARNLPPFEGEKPEKQTVTTLTEEDGEEDDGFPFI